MMRNRRLCSAAGVNRKVRYAITAVILLLGVLACQSPTPTLEPTPRATAKPIPTLAAATPIVAPTRTPTPTPTMVPPLTSTQSPEPEDKPLLEVSDASCAQGQEASVDVRLSRVGDGGLAGYEMALALEPPALARFAAVEFPQGYGRSSGLPDSSVNLSFLNTERAIKPGGMETRLATLRLQCLQPGEGGISLTIRAIDDERGAALDVETKTGHVSVSK